MKYKSLSSLVIFLGLLLFSPSIFNFFSSDDWFHLRVSQITSIPQFLNFFSFQNSPQSTLFYRPLSTQSFFFVFQTIFGLHPVFFHLFFLCLFALILTQLYRFIAGITKSKQTALLALIIYAFSITNLPRLYFLSGSQEIFLSLFTLLCFNAYLSKTRLPQALTYFWFLLALLSKETAIFIPIYLFLIDTLFLKRNSFRRLLPLFIISGFYSLLIYTRLATHLIGDATYVFNFYPKTALNTLMWYVLWALGAPELLVDYIGPGLRPIPRFYTDFGPWAGIILLPLLVLIFLLIFTLFKSRNKLYLIKNQLFFAITVFIISLGPLLLLPNHKFTLEMAVPLIGFSLGLACLLKSLSRYRYLVLGAFLFLNLSMYFLLYNRHYTITRARVSQNIFTYLQKNYPQYPKNQFFFFINDTPNYGADWGSSKQIAHAINVSELFRVFYHDSTINVYYQDLAPPPEQAPIIKLSSYQFLQ